VKKYVLYSNLCLNFVFVPGFDTDTYLNTIGQFVLGYVPRFDSHKYCPFFPVSRHECQMPVKTIYKAAGPAYKHELH
jgi:hypothetical protein